MSDVICVFFLGSNSYRDHVREQANIRNGMACGATAGDTWHLGLRTYDVIDPFARYRDDEREPMTNPFWRARIEKAKRDSELYDRELAAREIEWSVSEVQDLLSIARGFDE